MIEYRHKNHMSIEDVAIRVGVSGFLIDIVERGGVTHPIIAEKIGKVYGLDEIETEALMPKHHRKHGGDYEPDRYRSLYDIKMGDIPMKLEPGDLEVINA